MTTLSHSNRRAVAYVRVSTSDQVDGQSLDQQKEALRNWASHSGMEIMATFQDAGVSGKSMKGRDGLIEALKTVKKTKGILVVLNLSRLSRSTIDLLTICDELEDYDCELVSLREQVDTRSAAGRLFLTVMGAVAQFQREASNETIKANMASCRRQGRRISRFAPFGWDFQGDMLVENKSEQDVRNLILTMRDQKASFGAIALHLNALGIPTKQRGAMGWQSASVLAVVRYTARIAQAA